jgi:hypothetical protein
VGSTSRSCRNGSATHSHPFTADTYQHVIPGMDEAAADRFDALVFGETGSDDPAAAEGPPIDT